MRQRLVRGAIALALSVSTLAGAFVVPAAAANPTTTLNFSGSATVQQSPTYGAICDTCAPDALFGGNNVGLGIRFSISAAAQWQPTASVSYQYSQSLLRQGQTLDLTDTLTGGPGPLTVTYHLSGDFGVYDNTTFPADSSIYDGDVQTFDFSQSGSGTCTLMLSGDGTYDCQTVDTINVVNADLWGIAGIKIDIPVTTTISITPDGVTTVRTITVGGSTMAGPDTLTFNGPTPSVLADPIAVPCSAAAGSDALYDLASTQSNPTLVATTSVDLTITVTVIISGSGTVHIATIGPGNPVVMNLTAPTNQVDLGPILANNVPPSVNAGGPYSGNEGTPIQFDGSATTSVCPVGLTYVWNFSDGGVAYGVQPYHTFTGPGTYSGQLTVTDLVGNSATAQFSVVVANLAPAVSAGPDTTAAWGRNVAFNGSATDPGSSDQATLSYAWSFGDGSPSATGGPSVNHAYAAPGTYVATFTACDQWGACASSTRTVYVRARNVTVSYLGSSSGTFDTSASFSASLVDEFGDPVNGRSIAFAAGPESEGSASTASNGIASTANVTELTAGTYTASASFAGDALYNAALPSTASFAVGVKGTSVTYTGALAGGPNKTISLSATLVDATGKPLAGRTIVFQLGTQTASAATDASGVAATTLKLNQKNGKYALTATYAPSGADTAMYSGSVASATFSLQSK